MGNRTEESEESDRERALQQEARLRGLGAQPNAAFQVKAASASAQSGARSPEYARVLERYLARLVELKQIPQALGVLRRELDHNPDDPGLYDRPAGLLDHDRLVV